MAARRGQSAHLSAFLHPGLVKGCSRRGFREENWDLCFCALQIATKAMFTLGRCQELLFPSCAAGGDLSTHRKTLSNVLFAAAKVSVL